MTTRKTYSSDPLTVVAPLDWHVRAGVGVWLAAVDVNHDWHPKSLRAALHHVSNSIVKLRQAQSMQSPPSLNSSTGGSP